MNGSALPPDVVRAATERVLASPTFAGTARSRDLLRYLVEAMLAGRSNNLKEYTVGAEGLGRGDKFDPRVDSIARAEASRLRNRLTLYYTTEGRDDAVVISLPTGGYVPAIAARTADPAPKPAAPPRILTARNAAFTAAGALAAALVLGLFQLLAPPRAPAAQAAAPLQVDIALGTPGELWHAAGTTLAISRDGTVMVELIQRADGTTRLYSRRLASLTATELPGTTMAFSPFFSPDGRWVAFVAGSELKKTLVDGGGSPVTIAHALATHAGAWGENGEIILTSDTDSALWRVPATGGQLTKLVDFGPGAPKPRFPHLLPDGKGILFGATSNNFLGSIDFVRRDGTGHKSLLPGGTNPRYLPSGHIVYANGPQLYAVKFDLDRAEVIGAPWLVLEDVGFLEAVGISTFDVTNDGTLIYVRAKAGGFSTIERIDETGRSKTLVSEPARRLFPRLSPSGDRLIYTEADGTDYALWSYDMATGVRVRLPSGPGSVSSPAWSHDGKHIFFLNDDMQRLAVSPADGSAEPRTLLETSGGFWSASPDGKVLGFHGSTPGQHLDLYTLPLETTAGSISVGKPKLLYGTRFTETQPVFSPDGKWLAYVSTEGGEAEVYVRPYPDIPGKPVKVSPGRGRLAAWSRTSPYIFYETWDRRIMRVRYRIEKGQFKPDPPTEWFSRRLVDLSVLPNYALAPDGRSIVALMPVDAEQSRDHFTLIRNFFDTLNRD